MGNSAGSNLYQNVELNNLFEKKSLLYKDMKISVKYIK